MGIMYPFYNEKTEEEKRDWTQYAKQIRKDMEERNEDPYKGHVIKAGTYHYDNPTYEQKVNAILQQSYEEKQQNSVNSSKVQQVQELSPNSQNSVNDVVIQQQAKQLLINQQNSVDSLVIQQNNANRANEIVRQSSVQTFARKVMGDRDDER